MVSFILRLFEMTNKKKKIVPMREIVPDDLPSFNPSGFFGGLTEAEGLIKFWEDDLVPKIDENFNFKLDCILKKFVVNLKLSPILWKRLAYWMLKHVKLHEKKYGEIKLKGFTTKLKKDSEVDYEFVDD